MVSPSSCAKIPTSLSMWAVSESIIERWTVIVCIYPSALMSSLDCANWSLCTTSVSRMLTILHFLPSWSLVRVNNGFSGFLVVIRLFKLQTTSILPFQPVGFWWQSRMIDGLLTRWVLIGSQSRSSSRSSNSNIGGILTSSETKKNDAMRTTMRE